jgi:3',5'-cyclic AMP phosphodiesterase CpdA
MTGAAEQMTTADAARMLGVSVRQVRNLVDAGELAEAGRVGSVLLLDSNTVLRLRERGSQRGRPWAEETAWAAVEMLDCGHTARLNAAQRSRLRARLREMDVEEFVRLARHRSQVSYYRASASFLSRLREHVALTGAAAVAEDRSVADQFGLATGDRSSVDGYVDRALIRDYEDEFFLAPDRHGNVVLRGTTSSAVSKQTASVSAIALDLAESLDSRERSAGLRVLAEKLDRL